MKSFILLSTLFLIGCVGSPPGNGDIKQSYIEFPHVPGLMGSCHSGDLDLKTESIEESDHGVVYLPETNSWKTGNIVKIYYYDCFSTEYGTTYQRIKKIQSLIKPNDHKCHVAMGMYDSFRSINLEYPSLFQECFNFYNNQGYFQRVIPKNSYDLDWQGSPVFYHNPNL